MKQTNITDLLKQKQNEYMQILKLEDTQTIQNILVILQYRRANKGKNINNEPLTQNEQKVFNLMEKFRQDIKEIFIENNLTLSHITDISPEEMQSGKIRKSINRANVYETDYGNWSFASSDPADGTNPYIARKPKDGMVLISNNICIYGGDNITTKTDKNEKKRAIFNKPNYSYEINPKNFLPVVTLATNKNQEPYFDLSEE